MKTVRQLLLGLLLLTVSCNKPFTHHSGPTYDKLVFNDSTSIEVDKKVVKDVKEFFNDYLEYGYSVVSLHQKNRTFQGVYVDHLQPGTYGLTFFQYLPSKDFVVISPTVIGNPKKTKFIVYHELAHKFLYNSNHCHEICNEILSSKVGYRAFYNNFERQKEVLFNNKRH